MGMNMLNHEQIVACRSNPLAAYLARRLPYLVITAMVIVLVALVGMASFFGLLMISGDPSPEPFPSQPLGFFTLVLLLAAGMVLCAELYWMRKYSITPEMFTPVCPVPVMTEAEQESEVNVASHLRDLAYAMRSPIQIEGMHLQNNMTRDTDRASQLLQEALADILETAAKALHEKVEIGCVDTGSGWRQIEHTRHVLLEIAQTAHSGARKARTPCKRRGSR